MKATAKKIDWSEVPVAVAGFISPVETFLTPGRGYAVLAISVYSGVTFLLVVDDLREPALVPAWCFDQTTDRVPADWICSVGLGGGVDLVIGPDFVARDLAAYSSLVDHERATMDALWHYERRFERG